MAPEVWKNTNRTHSLVESGYEIGQSLETSLGDPGINPGINLPGDQPGVTVICVSPYTYP